MLMENLSVFTEERNENVYKEVRPGEWVVKELGIRAM
jgi:hypothetical protein